MVSIPPQSKLMRKYRFLDEYNDIKTCRDAHQAASNVVKKTVAFAEMCFNEENELKTKQPSLLLDDSWPKVAEFNIFNALPKIDTFMNYKYPWLNTWPHSTRHLKKIIVSKHLSFHVFEICYGAVRISYPVAQSTFSVYFVFEINQLVDQGSDCIVKYFLEGSDEELIPYMNDNITQQQVKALLKKKLALSSTINLGSTVKLHDHSIRKLIQMKKEMLKEFRFMVSTARSQETIPFPYTAHIHLRKKCSMHGKNCPILCPKKHATSDTHHLPEEEFFEDTPSSGTLSSESSESVSFYDFLDNFDKPKDATKNKNKRRSRTLSIIKALSPDRYDYNYDDDDDDDDDDDVVDNKKQEEFELDFDFDDDDDEPDNK